jgi:hypothetical protein
VSENRQAFASTHTRVTRTISADPTSTALLMAGPTAFELWPGVQRIQDAEGSMLVEARLGGDVPVEASVRAFPPRRTPTAYVTRFTWSGPGLPLTTGELTLGYGPTVDGEVSTVASLELASEGVEFSTLDEAALTGMANGFLANLARAAELRNRAA